MTNLGSSLLWKASRIPSAAAHRLNTRWFAIHFASLGKSSRICFPSRIVTPGAISLGDRAFVGPGSHMSVGSGLEIGDDFMSGPNLTILGGNHDLDPELRPLRIARPENGFRIVIGNNVWIGANVTLLPGTVIGDDSVIASGAVVRSQIPSGMIAGGVPAKVIKPLDEATGKDD